MSKSEKKSTNSEPKVTLVDPLAMEENEEEFNRKKELWFDIFYKCPDAADQLSEKYKELGDKDFTMWVTLDLDDDIHALEVSKKVLSVCFEKENVEERKVLISDLIEVIDTLILTKKYLRDGVKKETV